MDEPLILRRIFPMRTLCTACRQAGHEIRSHSVELGVQYRKCISCGAIYKVGPIALEIDRGGAVSVIVPMPC